MHSTCCSVNTYVFYSADSQSFSRTECVESFPWFRNSETVFLYLWISSSWNGIKYTDNSTVVKEAVSNQVKAKGIKRNLLCSAWISIEGLSKISKEALATKGFPHHFLRTLMNPHMPGWGMLGFISWSPCSLAMFTSIWESSMWALPASETDVAQSTRTLFPTEFSAPELSHKSYTCQWLGVYTVIARLIFSVFKASSKTCHRDSDYQRQKEP